MFIKLQLFSSFLFSLLIVTYTPTTTESFILSQRPLQQNYVSNKINTTLDRLLASKLSSKVPIKRSSLNNNSDNDIKKVNQSSELNRKGHIQKFMSTCGILSTGLMSASLLPKDVAAVEDEEIIKQEPDSKVVSPITESIYDFDVKYNKETFSLGRYKGAKAAILTSIKLDDPLMLQNMPGLMDAYNKYGKEGLKVFLFPTEQGVYEGDVDKDIRIKMYQQYQFGQFPNSVIFDRLNVVGTTADPLYRYLSRTCKNGNGVGRITLNFEKFLIDADGVPVRRYPRKYPIEAMQEDIEAVINGKPLPPPSSAWYKAWKDAVYEADRGEYSFRRGLNYY